MDEVVHRDWIYDLGPFVLDRADHGAALAEDLTAPTPRAPR